MATTDYKFPTEIVELPSKGRIYPSTSPLSSGEIEMKFMTAREEDILTNPNYIQKGVGFMLDKLLKSLIVSNIDIDELIEGDKSKIVLAARILSYGKDYTFKMTSPFTGKEVTVTADLQLLEDKELIEFESGKNEFMFTLPTSKVPVTFKILNGYDNKKIDEEIKGLKKIYPDENFENTVRLKHLITSVDGVYDNSTIRSFVDNKLLAMDSRALKRHIKNISPDVITKFTYKEDGDSEEGVDIPFNLFDMFFPQS